MTPVTKLAWYRNALNSLGPVSLMRLQMHKMLGRPAGKLTSKQLLHPVRTRSGSSDYAVFEQVIVEREYWMLDRLKSPQLVIDCGANVGYSSAYFLSAFPDCHVIAVEPDRDNFQMLQENLKPYGDRCTAVNAAVWPSDEPLQFQAAFSGSGQEWARAVERAPQGTSNVLKTVTIPGLLASTKFDRISILKVDIEGAERELFGQSSRDWIDQVDNIVIELHGDDCSATFRNAVRARMFDTFSCGELTVCLAAAPKLPYPPTHPLPY